MVASNSPGIRESVRDGETGYLVPHGDRIHLAVRLGHLAGAPALVASLGVTARSFAETFTWDRAARQTESHVTRDVMERQR